MALGIVQVFAQKGYEVIVWVRSIDENNRRASIAPVEKAFDKLVSKEKMSKEDMEKALSLISITTSYDDLKDCDLIIEAISEDMDIKKETFKKLDEVCKKRSYPCDKYIFIVNYRNS
jgi:3-hydroxyacyl-CoA dehydrogenase (EC 1.1.1.35)